MSGRLAGWITREQDAVIEYLREENPGTILRWHRQLIAEKWTHKRRSPGRPRVMEVITDLVVRMARGNSRWGYTGIQGALKNVGHRVGRTTIANMLALGMNVVISKAKIRATGHTMTLESILQ